MQEPDERAGERALKICQINGVLQLVEYNFWVYFSRAQPYTPAD